MTTEQDTKPGTYRYTLRSTGHSSAKFGPCEVCIHHASEVFSQTEEVSYRRHDGTIGWTREGCFDFFGHKACLESRQKATENSTTIYSKRKAQN
jgi:hypothetical protein